MFKFLKDKLKEAFSKFSKDVDHESKEVEETVKELEEEAPVQLKKKTPSEPFEEHIIGEEVVEEQELGVSTEKESPKEKTKQKEEELVEEITFEEPEAEEQEIEQEAVQQAKKDIPYIDDEVLKELELEQEEKFEEEKEEPKVKREEKQEGEKPRVRETPQKTPKTPPSAEEVLDSPPAPDEDEKVISINDIEALKFKHETKEGVKELKEEIKKEEVPVKPKEEKKGFFSRLKEKIIGKDKQEKDEIQAAAEEGFVEDKSISDHDLEVQQLAQELDHVPQQIELPEEKPVQKVLEEKKPKKREEIKEEVRREEIRKPEIDDELEALKEEGYREVSLEQPRKVRVPDELEEGKEDKRGFFAKIADVVTKTVLSEEKFEELFWELEVALMENNVALEVVDKIKGDLKAVLVNKKIQRGKSLEIIRKTLQHSIDDLFNVPNFDLVRAVRVKKPYIISFVGINGSGKTTTIAKIAYMLKINNISCVIAASDTFRAAAIQQLEEHAQKVGVKLIKHDYGADPAAVAFDAIKYAQAKGIDCVLIDTAGRLHSNTNLMDEMKKIIRVAKPELKIFIGEAITGNDCIEQAKQFNKAIGIDGIILCKADVDEKGGAAISVSYVTGKPILYLGTGQKYTDLLKFDKKIIMDTINF